MHDLKDIRTRPDFYKEKLGKRDKKLNELIDELLTLDGRKREIQTKADELRKRKNEIAELIGRSKDKPEKVEELKKESISINSTLSEVEKEEVDLNFRLSDKAMWIPNIPSDDVPVGENETQNKEILKWGNPKTEKWIKPHWEIGAKLNILDFERGVKIAQSRFTVLSGLGAKLERAIMNFMLDHAASRG